MESQDEDISFILNVKEQFSQFILTDRLDINIYCSNILQNCEQCISKIFEIITSIATDVINSTDYNVKVIVNYINEIILILEMLKKLINCKEVHSFGLENVKSFPFLTGKIIFVIFNHCRASATIYGVNVGKIEEILKNLFSSCRDLQTFYLNTLCTQIFFNLSITEDLDILVNVLNINLQIAELANDLDVKTMAEQWKAYTSLCEQYSSYLKNTSIFNTTSNSVVKLVVNCVKSIMENYVEKYTLRTLKVTNFLLKILGKLYEIFEDSSGNDYGQVVYMFSYLKIYSSDYLVMLGKPADLFQKMDDHLSQIIDHLLKLLGNNNRFIHDLINFKLDNLEEDLMLGYIHLVICTMINITAAATEYSSERTKLNIYRCENIISFLFHLLPQCQTWFNLDLQYSCSTRTQTSVSLFEHLLVNTAFLVTTCDSDNYSTVEKCMYEAILGVDFWKALFACDLWIILASYGPTKLVYDQLMFLCNAYKKLNGNILFGTAPQKVHFTYLLEGLYKTLPIGYKIKVSQKYPINEDNLELWQAIKIKNIPCEVASKVMLVDFNILLEQIEKKLLRHADSHIYELINIYKTISTCTELSIETFEKIDIVQKWNLQILIEDIALTDKDEEEIPWFIDYIEALCVITERIIKENGLNTLHIKKILFNTSALMGERRSVALTLILLKFLYQVIRIEKIKLHMFTAEITNILHEALKCDNRLLQATVCEILTCIENDNKIVTTKLLDLVKHMQNQEYLLFMIKNKQLKTDSKLSRKDQLLLISKIKYLHICLRSQCHIESISGNFEIGLDSLLEAEEPASKKTKLDSTYIDNIILGLEKNTRLLSEINKYSFNDEHRTRIAALYEKLKCLCD